MYTKNDIFDQLSRMGAPRDSVVIFHSSLRSIGEIEGGGEGLLDALIEYFTADGGLFCVPTHTWNNVGKQDRITLDLTKAESNLGALALIAAADERGLRTENPTHSMVIFGDRERALDYAKEEAWSDSPTAAGSCYGRLLWEDGYVLLAGVCQNKNTYLHAVDELLRIPNRMSKDRLSFTVKLRDGEIIERRMFFYDEEHVSDVSLRFPKYETAFRYHRAITDGYIGDAPAQLCDARKLFETVKLIWQNSGGWDPLADETPIPPSMYCNKKNIK